MADVAPFFGNVWNVLWVACGGALGSVCRYIIARAWLVSSSVQSGVKFPWPTFMSNGIGSFVLGILVAWMNRHALETSSRAEIVMYFGAVGFCGGLTTFSTFMMVWTVLYKQGALVLLSSYIAASLLGGIFLFILGNRIGA